MILRRHRQTQEQPEPVKEPETVEETPDYEEMTNSELKDILDAIGVEYPKKATKKELITLLEGE